MKLPPAKKKVQQVPLPGTEVGDMVFFNHEGEPHTGSIMAHGKDGCTIAHQGERRRVYWSDVLGHHTRSERKFNVEDVGATGAIVRDQDGKRRFVAGEMPKPEKADKRPADPLPDDYAEVRKLVDKAAQPMKKALPACSGRLLLWKP